MEEKLKISQAVIVEGRYDKLKLSSILDALIVETNGFGIFKDKERLAFIRKLALERGIVLLTDSDHAGFMIRHYVASGIPETQIRHVYIPDIYGKERRKALPSAEGKLGVEGMTKEILLAAFEKAQVGVETVRREDPVTVYDLYAAGLSGKPEAKQKRRQLLRQLELPEFLSVSALLSCINYQMTKEKFSEIVNQL